MHMRRQRTVSVGSIAAAAIALLVLAGCSPKDETPEPPSRPAPTPSQPRADIDFRTVIGVANARPSGVVCVAIQTALEPGQRVALVYVPAAASDSTKLPYSTVLDARVSGNGSKPCVLDSPRSGLYLPGDSVYTVMVNRESPRVGDVYFAVLLPMNAFFRVGHIAGVKVSGLGDVLNFRTCSSDEGLHLTAWEGRPLRGRRVWHRYFPLGRDTQATCLEEDYLEGR